MYNKNLCIVHKKYTKADFSNNLSIKNKKKIDLSISDKVLYKCVLFTLS